MPQIPRSEELRVFYNTKAKNARETRAILRYMQDQHVEFEALNESLNDDATRAEYRAPGDGYRPSALAGAIGGFLVDCGNAVYGEEPSYQKFRAVEVIARVPYHSWASAAFTLLTLFYADEKRALSLAKLSRFARFASDNETMHVVVVSKLACAHEPAGFFRYTLIPMLFAFAYFWASYWLYLINPRYGLEVNYLFESHAFAQYARFLELHGDELKRLPMESDYLAAYGRHPRSQYEFFRSVRNDELIHRNQSVHEIRSRA